MKKGRKFFYGWWVVIAIAIMTFTFSWTTFSIVLKQLMEQFQTGRGAISLAQSISVLGQGIAGIVAGRLLSRFRPRMFILWGSVVCGGCSILLSLSPTLWYFFIFFCATGIAIGFNGVISTFTLLSRWFNRQWGTAVGIAQAGGFIGMMAITPLLGFIAANYGWRATYLFSGLLVLIVNIPLVLFVTRDNPQSMGLLPDGEQPDDAAGAASDTPAGQTGETRGGSTNTGILTFLKSPALWLVFICFAFMGIGYSVVVNHLVSFLTDMQVSATLAASALGFTVGLTAVAALTSGWLADKMSSRYVAILFTVLAVAGMLVLLSAHSMVQIWLFVVLYGLGIGASGTLLPIITRDIFGAANFSVLFGLTNILFVIGCATGAPLAGFIFDATGSYQTGFIIVTAIFVGAILAIYFAFGAGPGPFRKLPTQK